MGKFIHSSADIIHVIDSGGSVSMPLSFFITQEPAYALPASTTEQQYIQSDYRRTYNAPTKTESYLTIPWTAGDGYIANRATYAAAYQLFLDTPTTLAAAKEKVLGEMYTYAGEFVRNSSVIFNTYTFPASDKELWQVHRDYVNFTVDGDVPIGYYRRDISKVNRLLTLANLTNLLNTKQDLHYFVDLVIEDHEDNINALTTIPDVLNYDYTVGFPIVPYDRLMTFYAAYDLSIDATQCNGSPFGTAVGGASVLNGFLDLAHNDVRYVDYNADYNADSQQVGTLKFKYKPNYSNAPSVTQNLFLITRADNDANNMIRLQHVATTGALLVDIRNGTGAGTIISTSLGNWLPIADTEYEFEFHYDITTGNTYLKIDTVQFGATLTNTGTRTIDILLLRIGGTLNSAAPTASNFSMGKLKIYSI